MVMLFSDSCKRRKNCTSSSAAFLQLVCEERTRNRRRDRYEDMKQKDDNRFCKARGGLGFLVQKGKSHRNQIRMALASLIIASNEKLKSACYAMRNNHIKPYVLE
jgi:hypothetical protein